MEVKHELKLKVFELAISLKNNSDDIDNDINYSSTNTRKQLL